MRKFWFAIIDIVLTMTISYADSDGERLHDVNTTDNYNDSDDGSSENIIVVGDMLLTQNQLNYLYSTDSSKRFGLKNPFRQWTNAIVYYKFDKAVDKNITKVVAQAMSYIQNVSCVRFMEKDKKARNYVLIQKGKGCSSKIGMRQTGPQLMIIDGNACTRGNVIHEFLHSLGFLHMHTANVRDEYININWNNIKDDAKLNFKQFIAHVSMYDTEYDYNSITHYSDIAFAVNKSIPTIIAKKPTSNMGQRKAMSAGDIIRLNRMYNCPSFEVSTIKSNGKSIETQFSNGTNIGTDSNKTADNASTNGLTIMKMVTNENEMTISELNLNNIHMDDDNDDEDDMILTQEQFDALYSLNAAKRNGLKSTFQHWPLGIVPFEIDTTFPPEFISSIYDSMNYISNRSCIRFVERTSYDKYYIYITRGSGCSSEVGMRQTGRQLMNINEKYCPRGKIIHELLHSLGFLHMHTANERDNYIEINWSNIKPDAWNNFKQFVSHVSMFSTPYDYNSIMHYSPRAFAMNRSIPTIISVQYAPNMGQREGMSNGDTIRLNRMYKCDIKWHYTTTNPTTITTNEPSLSSTITPIESSTSDVGVHGSEKSMKSLAIEEFENEDKQRKPRTILGVLIFKLVGKN